MDDKVEWDDVQALMLRPFVLWPQSAHLIMQIERPGAVKAWLREALDTLICSVGAMDVRSGSTDSGGRSIADRNIHVNVAFTVDGLRRLGFDDDDVATFDDAFIEGMAPEPDGPHQDLPGKRHITTRRAGILGDIGANVSRSWVWGGSEALPVNTGAAEPKNAPEPAAEFRVLQSGVHALMMIFARDREMVDDFVDTLRREDNGWVLALTGDNGSLYPGQVTRHTKEEHFGFADGISQPILRGTRRAAMATQSAKYYNMVAPGEFVLGYPNERASMPASPSVSDSNEAGDLPISEEWRLFGSLERRDFGRNGTYLVARQLHQNVGEFDALVREIAVEYDYLKLKGDAADSSDRKHAAEILVGRRMDGEPLIVNPDAVATEWADQSQGRVGHQNGFGYHHSDPAGLICPVGSHVRRSNPRDTLDPDPHTSVRLSKQHRILRRGRIYGPKLDAGGFERGSDEDATDRGLFFIGLNADIAGQFEFIQDAWINNPAFGNLEYERDALLSVMHDTRISFPGMPYTRWVKREDKPPLVRVIGGAYFFLPGIKALRYLSRCPAT